VSVSVLSLPKIGGGNEVKKRLKNNFLWQSEGVASNRPKLGSGFRTTGGGLLDIISSSLLVSS